MFIIFNGVCINSEYLVSIDLHKDPDNFFHVKMVLVDGQIILGNKMYKEENAQNEIYGWYDKLNGTKNLMRTAI
jgi:hypothetical protein